MTWLLAIAVGVGVFGLVLAAFWPENKPVNIPMRLDGVNTRDTSA